MGQWDDETKKDKTSVMEVLEPVLSVAIPILAAAVGAFLGWHITEQKIHELDGRGGQHLLRVRALQPDHFLRSSIWILWSGFRRIL